jgi:hypothetical protein
MVVLNFSFRNASAVLLLRCIISTFEFFHYWSKRVDYLGELSNLMTELL